MNVDRRTFLVRTPLAVAGLTAGLWKNRSEDGQKEVLTGIRQFFRTIAQPDGSFTPGIDPHYPGNSDTGLSGIAAPAYAVILHKTFGWPLPYEDRTSDFFLSAQRKDGAFYPDTGTMDPTSPLARLYNTVQSVVALKLLGKTPEYDPVPVIEFFFEEGQFKKLPLYTTSFFALFYSAWGEKMPRHVDQKMRDYLSNEQKEDGYLGDHVASTFHAAHYYRLIGQEIPMADQMVDRVLRDQKEDGSWQVHSPDYDVHAAFDALFILRQAGDNRRNRDIREAYRKATDWILRCRNTDGGFSHFPDNSTSDVDAVYFHTGGLIQAGFLKPVKGLENEEIFGWGHLMDPRKQYSCID